MTAMDSRDPVHYRNEQNIRRDGRKTSSRRECTGGYTCCRKEVLHAYQNGYRDDTDDTDRPGDDPHRFVGG